MKEEGTCIDDIFWMREKECLLKRMFAREKETRRATKVWQDGSPQPCMFGASKT
jgi:hypothetical protein